MTKIGNTIEIGGKNILIEASLIVDVQLLVVNSRMRMPAPGTAEEKAEMEDNSLRLENNSDGTVTLVNEILIPVKSLKELANALKEDENGIYFEH